MVMVFGMIFTQAQELKGVTLGATDNPSEIETTLGGQDGKVFSFGLKSDGRAYLIGFSTTDRVWSDDLTILKDGLGSKYGVEFPKVLEGEDYKKFIKTDSVEYIIIAKHNRYMSPRYSFTFYIKDLELYKLNKEEEEAESSKDF